MGGGGRVMARGGGGGAKIWDRNLEVNGKGRHGE